METPDLPTATALANARMDQHWAWAYEHRRDIEAVANDYSIPELHRKCALLVMRETMMRRIATWPTMLSPEAP